MVAVDSPADEAISSGGETKGRRVEAWCLGIVRFPAAHDFQPRLGFSVEFVANDFRLKFRPMIERRRGRNAVVAGGNGKT